MKPITSVAHPPLKIIWDVSNIQVYAPPPAFNARRDTFWCLINALSSLVPLIIVLIVLGVKPALCVRKGTPSRMVHALNSQHHHLALKTV